MTPQVWLHAVGHTHARSGWGMGANEGATDALQNKPFPASISPMPQPFPASIFINIINISIGSAGEEDLEHQNRMQKAEGAPGPSLAARIPRFPIS